MNRSAAAKKVKDAFVAAKGMEGAPPSDGDNGGLPKECPIIALGQGEHTLYFLDCAHQLQVVETAKLGRLKIIQLGGSAWLYVAFPQYDRTGENITGWKHNKVGESLIDACIVKGIYDPVHRVRGRGAWRGEDGGLVFHCGNRIWCGKRVMLPGQIGEFVYPGSAALPEPEFSVIGDDDYSPARVLFDTLLTWNWHRGDIDAKLLLGWFAAAMLGAAAKWRPMIWITGDAGTGKSTLHELIHAVMGQALIQSADATRAGLFQMLGFSSLPVALDEIESEQDDRRAQDIIKLARMAASGGVVVRGSSGGDAVEFTARSAFFFSSILIPPLGPADKSRMAICELGRLAAGASPLDNMERWSRIGRQMLGTLIREWPRYDATFGGYRDALIARGHDARAADQFGALGAGYSLLMHDGFDAGSAAAWAAMLEGTNVADQAENVPDHARCLDRLLTYTLELPKEHEADMVGAWLKAARAEIEAGDDEKGKVQRLLRSYGIKVLADPREHAAHLGLRDRPWWVAVANSHVGTAKIFDGTHWKARDGANGAWVQALRRVPQSEHGPRQRVYIDGRLYRSTWLAWEEVFPAKSEE